MGNADDDDTGGLPRHLDPADGTPRAGRHVARHRRRLTDALASSRPGARGVRDEALRREDHPEIGTETGLDEGTIKSHLFRAGRKLRALLEDLR
jgi:DNA-directed RNA polymerase specialized sigma24 family protein